MSGALIITSNAGLENSTVYIVVDVIEYSPNAIAGTTIIKKLTGDISVLSFDKGQGLPEKTSAFDTFIMVIEGAAELLIGRRSNIVAAGKGIIIPAHTSLLIVQAAKRFKIMQTIIKSGHELYDEF